jgi:hypothetical protein
LLNRDRLGSRNHEDAIYPTTKLSMINIASRGAGVSPAFTWQSLLSRKQERKFHTAS